MTLYAASPHRRLAQILGDLSLLLWAWLWVALARTVHAATMKLAAPGREIASAGTGLAARLRSAGDTLGGIPLVGNQARGPFRDAGGAARRFAAAGTGQVHAVESLAFWLGLVVAVLPILLALVIYLPRRIRFVRRATAGRRFLDSADDLDLFALRALSHQPLHVLARVSDDPAGAWRAGDQRVVRELAGLELRDAGLTLPRATAG